MEITNMEAQNDFTELAMEDHSYILNSPLGFEGMGNSNFILDSPEDYSQTALFGESLNQSFMNLISDPDPKCSSETCLPGFDRPKKKAKNSSWDSSITEQLQTPQPTFCNLITFGNSDYKKHNKQETVPTKTQIPFGKQNHVPEANEGPKRIRSNSDHIIAERKRRENLSQKFIALCVLIPGLKKMDKASVLTDATKYLKQLQDQVKELEEQTRKNTMTTESAGSVKRHEPYDDDHDSSSNKNFTGDSQNQLLPEIEARIRDGNVLIRIHCERRKGIVEKTITEIEKHQLSVLNSSVLSFGCSILDITIVAEMERGSTVSIKDLAKHLRVVFKPFK